MTEDSLSKINIGKMSRLILEGLGPRLNTIREKRILELKQMYSTGQATESKMLAIAAQLVALDDLQFSLEKEIKTGEAIAMKEMKDA